MQLSLFDEPPPPNPPENPNREPTPDEFIASLSDRERKILEKFWKSQAEPEKKPIGEKSRRAR